MTGGDLGTSVVLMLVEQSRSLSSRPSAARTRRRPASRVWLGLTVPNWQRLRDLIASLHLPEVDGWAGAVDQCVHQWRYGRDRRGGLLMVELTKRAWGGGTSCPRTVDRLTLECSGAHVAVCHQRGEPSVCHGGKHGDPAVHDRDPEAELEDLRARVAATRFPDRETVDDPSQGVELATTTALARYRLEE